MLNETYENLTPYGREIYGVFEKAFKVFNPNETSYAKSDYVTLYTAHDLGEVHKKYIMEHLVVSECGAYGYFANEYVTGVIVVLKTPNFEAGVSDNDGCTLPIYVPLDRVGTFMLALNEVEPLTDISFRNSLFDHALDE